MSLDDGQATQLIRKYNELEKDFLQMKNKYSKQQNKLERCLMKLNTMTKTHE